MLGSLTLPLFLWLTGKQCHETMTLPGYLFLTKKLSTSFGWGKAGKSLLPGGR